MFGLSSSITKYCLFSIVFLLFVHLASTWRNIPPRVKLKQGIVEGLKLITESAQLQVFFGVPYAAPPVGQLRFEAPTSHQGWNGTYQAVNIRPGCAQLPIRPENEIEDCLYLDIWTPEANSTYEFPVVVFLSGVDFSRDSTLKFNGQDFASKGIIVVRVSYRLNILGFFCLGNSEFRGNLGLLDQYFALLWVKNNIVYFGGNSQNVTLFGHYSGATSASLHISSPRTAGLFQRAIISSGSATQPWIIDNETIEISKQLVRILRCDANTASCLKRKSVRDLLQALQIYSESVNKENLLLPVTDSFLRPEDRYLPLSGIDSLREGVQMPIPSIIGIGWPIVHPEMDEWIKLLSNQGYYILQNYIEKVKIPELIQMYKLNAKLTDLITNLIEWEYSLFIDTNGRFLVSQLEKLDFEAKIEAPLFQQVSYMALKSSVPMYVYSVKDIDLVLDVPDKSVTADMVLFSGPVTARHISRRRFNSRETLMSEQLQDYLANFIIFGNPTPFGRKRWRKYEQGDPYVEEFGESESGTENGNERLDQRKRMMFWNDVMRKYSDSLFSQIQPSISVELSNNGAGSGLKNVILGGLLVILLLLLVVCIILLKKKSKILKSNSSWTLE